MATKGRKLSVLEVRALDNFILVPHPREDWLEWMYASGCTGDDTVHRYIHRAEIPYWVHVATSTSRPPDWHRLLEHCNVHALDNIGDNAFSHCCFVSGVTERLLAMGVDWRHYSSRKRLTLLNLVEAGYVHGVAHEHNLALFIDLYLEHEREKLIEIMLWPPANAHKYPAVVLLKTMTRIVKGRRRACHVAIVTFCLFVRKRCGFPRDVANIVGRLVWATRGDALEWHVNEET